VYECQHSSRYGKTYFKYPSCVIEEDCVIVNRVAFEKPPPRLVDNYKIKKAEYIRKLNLDLEKTLKEESEKHERSRVKDPQKYVSEILKKKDELCYLYRNRWTVKAETVATKFNLGLPTARKIKAAVELKLAKEYPT
jgi:hypothetical protein